MLGFLVRVIAEANRRADAAEREVARLRKHAMIYDHDALSAVSVQSLHAYLRQRGWKRIEAYGDKGTVYGKADRFEVVVPESNAYADYAQTVGKILAILSDAESRSETDVLREILAPGAEEMNQEVFRTLSWDEVDDEIFAAIREDRALKLLMRKSVSGEIKWLPVKIKALYFDGGQLDAVVFAHELVRGRTGFACREVVENNKAVFRMMEEGEKWLNL